MNRRTFVKAAGSIGAASALGVGASVLASNPVSAGSDMDIGEVELSSDDGTIDHVSIYGDGRLDWDGFDTPATQVQIQTYVTVSSDGEELVDTRINDTGKRDLDAEDFMGGGEQTSGSGTRGSIIVDVGLDENGDHDPSTDWAIIQASDYDDPYDLPEDPVDASQLTVGEDGEATWYHVEVETKYHLYAEDDAKLSETSATDSLNVKVKNIESSSSAGDEGGEDGATGGVSNDGEQL